MNPLWIIAGLGVAAYFLLGSGSASAQPTQPSPYGGGSMPYQAPDGSNVMYGSTAFGTTLGPATDPSTPLGPALNATNAQYGGGDMGTLLASQVLHAPAADLYTNANVQGSLRWDPLSRSWY